MSPRKRKHRPNVSEPGPSENSESELGDLYIQAYEATLIGGHRAKAAGSSLEVVHDIDGNITALHAGGALVRSEGGYGLARPVWVDRCVGHELLIAPPSFVLGSPRMWIL